MGDPTPQLRGSGEATRAHTATPLTPMRKVIAARMQAAKQTIPHFRLAADFEATALVALRHRLLAERSDVRVSLNDLIIKACALTLVEHGEMNIQFVDGQIHQFDHAHVTVVTALPGGLTTPVVWDADLRSVFEISEQIRMLGEAANENRLRMDQIAGGTFGVSNLGMFGVRAFDAIINPPQCAMLAVGAVRRGHVFPADGEPTVGDLMTVTLSVDHRAIDGATAARFMAALQHRIQSPARLAEASSEEYRP